MAIRIGTLVTRYDENVGLTCTGPGWCVGEITACKSNGEPTVRVYWLSFCYGHPRNLSDGEFNAETEVWEVGTLPYDNQRAEQ